MSSTDCLCYACTIGRVIVARAQDVSNAIQHGSETQVRDRIADMTRKVAQLAQEPSKICSKRLKLSPEQRKALGLD